jgi:hypothetical protein
MSGFPASISITESDAGGSGIYTIGVTDTDTFACFQWTHQSPNRGTGVKVISHDSYVTYRYC